MEFDGGKTRAEILDELNVFHSQPSREKNLNELLRILNLPPEDLEHVRAVKRAEKEYFLICRRASRRKRDAAVSGAGTGARLNISDASGQASTSAGTALPSVDRFLEGLGVAAADESSGTVLMKIALAAGELMGAETTLLALLDESGATYSLRAAAGPRALDCLGISLPVKAESACGWVIRQNSTLTTDDAMTDLRIGSVFRESVRAQAVAAAPLTQKGAVVGAIAVANGRGGRLFTRSDASQILAPFARSVSLFLPAAK